MTGSNNAKEARALTIEMPKYAPLGLTSHLKEPAEAKAYGRNILARPSLTAELVTITPELAEQWLSRKGVNRPVYKPQVESLKRTILNGEWRLTGEAIKLDSDGKVRDGQHRLQAIVEARTPVTSLVVRGVDEEAFDVMDSGRKRNVADVLSMHDYVATRDVAAAVRSIMNNWEDGRYSFRQSGRKAIVRTASETLRYLEEHPDILEGLRIAWRVCSGGQPRLPLTRSLWGVIFTILLRTDSQATYEFVEMLRSGADLSKDHPVLVLRNRVFAMSTSHMSTHRISVELPAYVFKAWNAWRKGQPIKVLILRDTEDYPQPV